MLRVLETANLHRIPSPEMPAIELEQFFIAQAGDEVVGAAGWKVLGDGRGKTTLMAVDPAYRGRGIGRRLQELRMAELLALGCTSVVTNVDRPETIAWYEQRFGYRVAGQLEKAHEFGAPEIDRWTTMEADLVAWQASRRR